MLLILRSACCMRLHAASCGINESCVLPAASWITGSALVLAVSPLAAGAIDSRLRPNDSLTQAKLKLRSATTPRAILTQTNTPQRPAIRSTNPSYIMLYHIQLVPPGTAPSLTSQIDYTPPLPPFPVHPLSSARAATAEVEPSPRRRCPRRRAPAACARVVLCRDSVSHRVTDCVCLVPVAQCV